MTSPRRCLVIGSGSIARRHIVNLRRLLPEAEIACVSASGRTLSADETAATMRPATLADAVAWGPELAIVASPAPFHLEHSAALLDAGVPVLIEKPLSDALSRFDALESLFSLHRERIEIAYNLRYLSSSQRMKQLIGQGEVGRIHSIRIDIGQYLPDWRPQSDYRRNVSANKALGGGVLLELSHEFDYLTWIFGRFDKVYCITSNSGQLEIDVEDRADIMLSRADGVVAQLHMDFLQRKATRQCKVIGECGTLLWNLNTNSIALETAAGEQPLFADPYVDRNEMYVEQLRGFIEVAAGRSAPRITLDDGLVVMGMVEAMRHSASTGYPTFIQSH